MNLNPVNRLLDQNRISRPAVPVRSLRSLRTESPATIERSGYKLPQAAVNLSPGAAPRLLQLTLPTDGPDAPQILAHLMNLVEQYAQSPFVREVTVRLLSRDTGNNDIGEQIRAVTAFVRDNLVYVRDPIGTEYVISPVNLLTEILNGERTAADCDDHVLLLCSMLGSLGIECRPIGVKLYSATLYDHVIAQVLGPRGPVDVDPCAKNRLQPVYTERLVPS